MALNRSGSSNNLTRVNHLASSNGLMKLNKAISSTNLEKLAELQSSTEPMLPKSGIVVSNGNTISSNLCFQLYVDEKIEHGAISSAAPLSLPDSTETRWTLCASTRDELEEWIQAVDLASSLGQMVEEIESSLNIAVSAPASGIFTPKLYSALAVPEPVDFTLPADLGFVSSTPDGGLQLRFSALVMATENMLQSVEMIEIYNRDRYAPCIFYSMI